MKLTISTALILALCSARLSVMGHSLFAANDGGQLTDTKVSFTETCDSLNYNNLNLRYEFILPLKIELNQNQSLVTLKVKVDEALASSDADLAVNARLTKPGEAELIFQCKTFARCQGLEDEVKSNPVGVQRAVKFFLIGSVDGKLVKLGFVQAANQPKFYCETRRWVVIQKRVDGSISFALNWDAYLKGFGHPGSNYWMGLEKLFAMTVTSSNSDSARCELRIEMEDFHGRSYWSEYGRFEVLGPEHNYKLRVSKEVPGSVKNFGYHNECQFSTLDKNHNSCSHRSGYGGWWFNNCHTFNLNGAYTHDLSLSDYQIYNAVGIDGIFVVMKKTVMKFRCY